MNSIYINGEVIKFKAVQHYVQNLDKEVWFVSNIFNSRECAEHEIYEVAMESFIRIVGERKVLEKIGQLEKGNTNE